ncbi:Sec-independent protein translocase protein TatB, partial [Desulfovibrio sp.]|uniref:Sec-independent protein translocase protein TatB n=1 Tax=Desulfovibrio sp. TaxID=885 RepID=UPI003D0C8325
MFGIGSTELLVILVVALIVLGPKSLANVSRTLGKAMGEFRRVSTDFQRTLNAEAEEEEQRKRKQEAARAAKEAAAAAKEAHAAEMAAAAAAATEGQPAATTTAQADNIPASEAVIDATATRPAADAGQN